ncbi:hypothetical protein N7481_003338 [Penicillium waksmanii]|uniref:uncharacterized protein n=1 Tax=Penicillium waksmanii TaxID=69791 RepID=UPI002546FAD0|nr:uncharacterized protein N7481_003338 [Penicillium waksmanii]KAJ5988128.1 hypothetical protein N7481_003338 [Penicillium waksmanii]
MSDSNGLRRAAGDIAHTLDGAGIPSILWGYAALGLVGQVKTSNLYNRYLKPNPLKKDIYFVVPDELVQKVTDILIDN